MSKRVSDSQALPMNQDVLKRNPNYRGSPNVEWFLETAVNIPVTDKISASQTDRVIKSLVECLRNYRKYVKELDIPAKIDHEAKVLSETRAKL